MNLIIIETRAPLTTTDLSALYPEVSFPPDADWTNEMLADYGAAVLEDDPQPALSTLESLQYGDIREQDGHWYRAWVVIPGTAEQWAEYSTAELQSRQGQANAQVTAIQGRITTLNWKINEQDPEELGDDYDPPTPEDIAELAAMRSRYTKWNAYSNKLGKVKAQPTWPQSPVWPVMPEPYTNETSAVAQPVA